MSGKILRLSDNSSVGKVSTDLNIDPGHEMMVGVVQFKVRISAKRTASISLMKDDSINMAFRIRRDDAATNKFWFYNGTAPQELQAVYAIDTWYTIRIHFDCLSRAAIVWIAEGEGDPVFKLRTTLHAGAHCDYVNKFRAETDILSTAFNFDIDDFIFLNLSVH